MKNKMIRKIISFFLFIVMLWLFIYLGTKDYSVTITDNVIFANEYKDISKNNLFVYAKEYEILDILNGKSGIIFMGFPSNIWSHYYADYLNEICKLNAIDKIYYYDFKKDREINNREYLSIVNKLADYLYVSDTLNMDLFAPTILIVKNGEILYFDDSIRELKGKQSPEEYFTDYRKNMLMAAIDNALKEYLEGE